MENELFQAIKTQINSNVTTGGNPDFNFIHIWNNQLESLKSEDENGNHYYDIAFPALFVEFNSPEDIQQLGNGVQIYDPLDIRIHIVHNEIDSGDGNFEQNVNVFALKQKVYAALQGLEPNGAVAFVRIPEEQDYEHTNLYHYIQTYRTNYVDTGLNQPVNGIPYGPPIVINDTYTFTPGQPN